MNKLIIDKGVCRIALTTKGFLITMELVKQHWQKRGPKEALKKLIIAVKGIFLKSNFLEFSEKYSSTYLDKFIVLSSHLVFKY